MENPEDRREPPEARPVRVGTRLAIAISKWVAAIPCFIRRKIGFVLGDAVYFFARRRKEIALANLQICFPTWSLPEREALARDHFRIYACAFLDAFEVWFGSPGQVDRLVQIEGADRLEALRGRPILILAPHFMGIDAGGVRLQRLIRGICIYSVQSSEVLTDLMKLGRARFNDPVLIARQEGIKPVVRWIRKGLVFHISPDMDLGMKDALFVPFFGELAATVTTLPRLAAMTNAVVVPYVTEMTPRGWLARLGVPWENYPSGDLQADLRRMNEFIEEEIRKRPAQYLWTHRRFKTRPSGESSIY